MRMIYVQYLYGHDICNNNKIPFRFLSILIPRIEMLNNINGSSVVALLIVDTFKNRTEK